MPVRSSVPTLTPNTSLVRFRRAIIFGEAQEVTDIARTIERTFSEYFGHTEPTKKPQVNNSSNQNALTGGNAAEAEAKGLLKAKGAQVTLPSAAVPTPLYHPPPLQAQASPVIKTILVECPETRRSSNLVEMPKTTTAESETQEPLIETNIMDFDPTKDVIVVIARVNNSSAMNRAAAFAKRHTAPNPLSGKASASASLTARDCLGSMIIVANTASKEHVVTSCAQLNENRWLTSIAVSSHLAPPSFCPEEVPEFKTRLRGPLENICLGVALGVSRQLSVNASTYVQVAPMDLTFAVGYTALSLSIARRIPHSVGSVFRLLIEIGNPNEGLVWGMVGEYAIDYYGRYQQPIRQVMPNIFTDDPTINFHIHFSDVWNYGIHLMHPVTLYRARLGLETRTTLKKIQSTKTSTAVRMQNVLDKIDDVEEELAIANPVQRFNAASIEIVKNVVTTSVNAISKPKTRTRSSSSTDGEKRSRQAISASESSDYRMYSMLVSMVTSDSQLSPLLPFVSLGWVKWERYVKSICVGVLAFAGRHVLGMAAEEVNRLPSPTMMFHNDFAFRGEERAPEPNMRLRQFFPDLFWMLRSGQQPSGNQIPVAPGGRRLVAILAQPQVQLMMSQIAKEQNVDKHSVEQRADKILRQIGDTINQRDMRTAGTVVRKIFQALYERININADAYDILFKAFRKPRTSVVVLPAHRSYIDFLFLGYMLLTFGFPAPHAASGEDFLRLGPLANLLRGSGAFFMRRSFRGDRLYSGLFKEYVRHLVRDGQCIEFFIEGLRSRTGKTVAPKVGLLKMVTDAFFEKQEEVDDVLFVPISLSYEKLLEGNVYANELLGIPKPKETIPNLIKSASVLKDSYGALNIVVNEPISLAALAKDPFAAPEGYSPIPPSERNALKLPNPNAGGSKGSTTGPSGSYTPPRVLATLGWRITYDIQQNLVVTPTALLAAVLMSMIDHTKLRVSGAPLSLVAGHVEWLRTTVLRKGGRMDTHFASRDGTEIVSYAANLLSPNVTLSSLSTIYIEESVTTKMLLNIYANQLIHVFADEAIVCVAAFAFGREQQLEQSEAAAIGAGNGVPATGSAAGAIAAEQGSVDYCIAMGDLKKRAQRLQRLMSNELPNFQPTSTISFDSWLGSTLHSLKEDGAIAHMPLSDAPDEELRFRLCQFSAFAAHQLYNYIESFFVTLASVMVFIPTTAAETSVDVSHHTSSSSLKAAPGAAATHVSTVKIQDAQLQKLAHEGALELFRKKLLDYVQCSSKENIKNCVLKIEELGYFSKDVSPAVTYIVRRTPSYEDLRSCFEEVNAMRWRPSGPAELEKIITELRHVFVTKVVVSNTKL